MINVAKDLSPDVAAVWHDSAILWDLEDDRPAAADGAFENNSLGQLSAQKLPERPDPCSISNKDPKYLEHLPGCSWISQGHGLPQTHGASAPYVRKNSVPTSGLSNVIESVHETLKKIASGESFRRGNAQKPAVSVKESVKSDYLDCLEDGKKLKTLKRYLRSRFGLSPNEYRAKRRLPSDYPMVAAEYSARRSAFAKRMGCHPLAAQENLNGPLGDSCFDFLTQEVVGDAVIMFGDLDMTIEIDPAALPLGILVGFVWQRCEGWPSSHSTSQLSRVKPSVMSARWDAWNSGNHHKRGCDQNGRARCSQDKHVRVHGSVCTASAQSNVFPEHHRYPRLGARFP